MSRFQYVIEAHCPNRVSIYLGQYDNIQTAVFVCEEESRRRDCMVQVTVDGWVVHTATPPNKLDKANWKIEGF